MHKTEEQMKVKNTLFVKRIELFGKEQPKSSLTLLKYFPKYIDDLEIIQSQNKAITKLKKVKVIRKFYSQNLFDKSLRMILATKAKAVQKYSRFLDNPKGIIQGIRLFPFMKEFSFSRPVEEIYGICEDLTPSNEKSQANKLYRIAQNIKGLPKLECLYIYLDGEEPLEALKALDSYQRLKDLKWLKIRFDQFEICNQKTLDCLHEMKNLLKYVTCLDLSQLDSNGFESLKKFPEKCISLKQLSFSGIKRRFDQDSNQIHSNQFQAFEAFQKLERITIIVGDTFTFIRDFTLPISIKNVKIHFSSCGWNPEGDLREDPMFIQFYEKWRKLKNLDALELNGCGDIFKEQYLDFCQELLKRVPQVRELRFFAEKAKENDKIFDLAKFFKPLGQINNGLEILEIKSDLLLLLKEEIHFPKLLRLRLKGSFQEIEMKHYIGLFENRLEDNPRIELEETGWVSSQGFFKLLEQFKMAEDCLEIVISLSL